MAHVGAALARVEDDRFLTGRGRFVDDIRLPGEAYAAFVRSPHARARIGAIATERARAMPGVLAVLTGEDWRRDGGGDTDVLWDINSHDGTPMSIARRPIFASGEARHVGDTVALVVAEDPHAAADAAAAVDVAWEPLPSITELAAAVEPDAPLVHEEFGSNVAYDWRLGDAAATKAAFAAAAHVTSLKLVNNRLAPSAMEPRAAIGAYDRGDERYTLWSTTQNPHLVRQWLSRDTLHAPEHAIRVVAPDVGGGFGQKTYHYPEEASLPWAARLVGRPVRWTATRTETLSVDIHARDHVTEARMAFDADGRIAAVEATIVANLGAYQSQFAACIPTLFCVTMFSGQYAIPALHCRVLGAYTNTTPIDAYRGAGNPEITYVIERLIENGAREMAGDSVEARARNLVPASNMPYASATGITYDVGDFPAVLDKARALADLDALKAEQAKLREDGVLMGIGIAAFVAPAAPGRAGLPPPSAAAWGSGTSPRCGSIPAARSPCSAAATTTDSPTPPPTRRSWPTASAATWPTSTSSKAIPTGSPTASAPGLRARSRWWQRAQRRVGPHHREGPPPRRPPHGMRRGRYRLRGRRLFRARHRPPDDLRRDRRHGLSRRRLSRGFELGLEEAAFFDPDDFNYPYGTHVATVTVDAETGAVRLTGYYSVEDTGLVINPLVVDGQRHGAAAQASARRCWRTCATSRSLDSCSPAPSWTTRCPAPTTCPISRWTAT